MRNTGIRSALFVLGTGLLVAGCAGLMGSGPVGGLFTLLIAAVLMLGTACSDEPNKSGSSDTIEDTFEDPDIGPCLSAPPPDTFEEPDIGPCLSAPPPDTFEEPDIGPCLSAPPPEDVEEGDAEDTGSDGEAVEVGPCLTAPAPADAAALPPIPNSSPVPAESREALRARLLADGILPADVGERLNKKEPS